MRYEKKHLTSVHGISVLCVFSAASFVCSQLNISCVLSGILCVFSAVSFVRSQLHPSCVLSCILHVFSAVSFMCSQLCCRFCWGCCCFSLSATASSPHRNVAVTIAPRIPLRVYRTVFAHHHTLDLQRAFGHSCT